MSATTASLTHTISRPAATKPVWRPGIVAGVFASVATVAVAALAQAADVPLEVGGEDIPLAGFAQLTFVATMLGTLLAALVSRRARHPRHTFVVTTVALTILSIVPDVFADAQTATRVVLALSHVVAAAIVIPRLASRLSD
jgi:hypothetical protein